jgi:ATP-dependent helicase/nuclease subunit A
MPEALPAGAAARERIAADLATSLLVEAGAGSGKTAAMVGRMVALVRTGASTVDQIAAVTFTRKAAGELRERFREALERALREAPAAGPERPRLARALADPGGAFVGTVHAFCARLLRDRPIEAGLPPGFREADEGEEERLFADGWSRFLEHLGAGLSRLPAALARVGLRPADLRGLFRDVAARPDVRFAAPPAPRPDPALLAAVHAELEALLDASVAHLPTEQPAAGWDALQSKLLALRFSRGTPGWSDEAAFHDALSIAAVGPNDVVRRRWGAGAEAKDAAAGLCERWTSFGAEGGAARGLLAAWLAHRYPPALRLARAAAAFCARERRRAGIVTFDDLLVLAASLLRRSEAARRELAERWRYLLVDEFQDTDPLQAEVVFLLAAADAAVGDWRRAVPRPGALFVVGDPKQSIYRIRRADLAVYQAVKARFHRFGAVLRLTTSFRASPAVAAFVNRVFAGLLPAGDEARQPAFAPLVVGAARGDGGRVGWYAVEAEPGRGRVSGRRVAVADAAALASWIAGRVASGERAPGDFLVITRTRHHLAEYARALEMRGVPVHLAGGGAGAGAEIRELALLLRALADPGDAVRTVAVLEGPFFGLSHDDLHGHAAAGGSFCFAIDTPATGLVSTALVEMRGMARTAAAMPADAAVEAIADRIGLLPYAATGESGAANAGALLFALGALRASSPGSLTEAAERLERTGDADLDAPLRPGERDAVRVMNLHRAKGLEAPVVILACPSPAAAPPPPSCAVVRGYDGVARGWLLARGGPRRAGAVLASPARWHQHASAEAAWSEAEEVRLLYVAATRARDELVIARCGPTAGTSAWRAFHAALDDPALAAEMPVRAVPPPPRPVPEDDAASILARAASLAEQRRVMARHSYRLVPRPMPSEQVQGSPADGGIQGSAGSWRTAIHRALAAAANGASGGVLRGVCRDALFGDRAQDGGSAKVDELLAFTAAVRASAIWDDSEAAERRLVGVPFAIRIPADEARAIGITDDQGVTSGELVTDCDALVEGVLDLAFCRLGKWTIVDCSTFATRGSSAEADVARCRCRLDLHATCWERITGEPVESRLVMSLGAQVEW